MAEVTKAARLIAEMISADSWSMPDRLDDHPILGPAIAHRNARYSALKRHTDFTEARIIANSEAIDMIMKEASRGDG